MMILQPVSISAVSVIYTVPTGTPIGNLLLDHPELYYSCTLDVTASSVTIEATVTGTINSFVLLGVELPVTTIDFFNGADAPVVGAVVTGYADPYWTLRRNYWIRFPTATGTAMKYRFRLPRTAGTVGWVARAGVLKAGVTHDLDCVLFPLDESMDDPTVQIVLADGTVYRAAEMAPRRMLSAAIRSTRAKIEAFSNICRWISGRPTMYHFAPTMGDRFFLYGQMLALPQCIHDYPTTSTASISVREIM